MAEQHPDDDAPAAAERAAAERAYVEGLIARGEAAEPDEHGNLPPGATHEIVARPDGQLPVLRRRRFAS